MVVLSFVNKSSVQYTITALSVPQGHQHHCRICSQPQRPWKAPGPFLSLEKTGFTSSEQTELRWNISNPFRCHVLKFLSCDAGASAALPQALSATASALSALPHAFRGHHKALEEWAMHVLMQPHVTWDTRLAAANCCSLLPNIPGSPL